MSTRRVTRARVQTQQNSPQPTQHNTSADDEGDVSPRMLHKLTKEVSDIKAQMAAMQANLHFISEQLRNPPHTHRASPRSSRPPSRHHHDLSGEEEDLQRPFPRQSPHTRRQRRVPPHPKETRIDLPPFHGKDNVEAYLDWVAQVEQLFNSHVVEEERRVSLAVLSFQGHALNWWTTLVLQKRKKGLPEIEYWFDLKEALHARHVPSYYKRELMDKLQRLQQRTMSVEEYRQKMELYILRAGIDEEEDLTIARFLSGLNYNIRDRVELLPHKI